MAGVNVLCGVDCDPKNLTTFRHNFSEACALAIDLAATPPERLMDHLGLERGRLDLLGGGPPCQGFSKNVPRRRREADSANNLLIRTFLDYCETLFPRWVLMENVAEMWNGYDRSYSGEVVGRLSALGYEVTSLVLHAADFGVPQRRRRAFFLATRSGPPPVLQPSGDPPVSVWDAIGDLPSVPHDAVEVRTDYACLPFSPYQEAMRLDSRGVTNHMPRRLRSTQLARLAALQPGQGHRDLPPSLQVKGGYSGAYGRLTKEMIAPTITRWVFHPGSGRWGHPVDVRTLTIREAARLQGFPDTFEFVGSFNVQAGQVGNAVPPLLVRQIAGALIGAR